MRMLTIFWEEEEPEMEAPAVEPMDQPAAEQPAMEPPAIEPAEKPEEQVVTKKKRLHKEIAEEPAKEEEGVDIKKPKNE